MGIRHLTLVPMTLFNHFPAVFLCCFDYYAYICQRINEMQARASVSPRKKYNDYQRNKANCTTFHTPSVPRPSACKVHSGGCQEGETAAGSISGKGKQIKLSDHLASQ